MGLLDKEPSKPGKRLMLAGLGAFLAMFAIGLMLNSLRPAHGSTTLEILLLSPLMLGAISALLVPGLFIHGLVSGVPGVSMMYALSLAKKNWRRIAGTILLVAASAAAIFAVVA
jgi:hypothetical protein